MYERRGRGFGRDDRGGGFRGGGFGRDFDKPKPVKVGEEYDVKITDVGAKGDGITKVENFIIFVPNTEKGESCRIKIKEVANKFAIGEKVGESKGDEKEEVSEESEKQEESSGEETEQEEVSEESEEESKEEDEEE